IQSLVSSLSARWKVQVYEFANSGNHLHFAVRAKTKEGFRNFFRTLAAQTATKVTGARRGNALGKRFWDLPMWSRIVAWGKAFQAVCRYVVMNRLEGEGLIPHQPRHKKKRPSRPGARGVPALLARPVRTSAKP